VDVQNVRAFGFYRRLGFEQLEIADPGPVVYFGRKL
jgi:ribosomal protein S18 acetylase RimI-like enzyme